MKASPVILCVVGALIERCHALEECDPQGYAETKEKLDRLCQMLSNGTEPTLEEVASW